MRRLGRTWEHLAREDPFWAVLSDPNKRGGGWNEAEFFETGRVEVQAILAEARDLNLTIDRGSALDFGCGVGRLTQALAGEFQQVTGVDISPTMLAEGRTRNPHDDRVTFVHNDDLTLPFAAASFDFVYSAMVLQHIRPEHSRRYIAEFIRVLRPTGLAVFQIPATTHLGRANAFRQISRKVASPFKAIRPRMEMNAIARPEVESVVRGNGGRLVAAVPDGHDSRFAGYRYYVVAAG